MVDVLLAYRGTIIEILGDSLLVLFGAPLTRTDAERAVAWALAMQLRLHATNAPNRQGRGQLHVDPRGGPDVSGHHAGV
jgi:adenylate cyclase